MSDSMRVAEHPILGTDAGSKTITIYFEDRPIAAREGEPIAAALAAAGIRVHRTTEKTHEPRGVYCAMGRCTDCMMIVDGEPNVRTCITPVRDGMRVQVQHGLQ